MSLYTERVIASIPEIVKAFKDGSTIHIVAETFNISPVIVEGIIRVAIKLQPINEISEYFTDAEEGSDSPDPMAKG